MRAPKRPGLRPGLTGVLSFGRAITHQVRGLADRLSEGFFCSTAKVFASSPNGHCVLLRRGRPKGQPAIPELIPKSRTDQRKLRNDARGQFPRSPS